MFAVSEEWDACVGKIKPHRLIGTLGSFQSTSGSPEDVVPKLGIVSASGSEGFFRFVGSASCLGIVVIDKTCHPEIQLLGTIRRGVGCSEAMLVIDVESSATVKRPYGGRGTAALSCSEYGKFISMRVGGFADAELGFNLVDCI